MSAPQPVDPATQPARTPGHDAAAFGQAIQDRMVDGIPVILAANRCVPAKWLGSLANGWINGVNILDVLGVPVLVAIPADITNVRILRGVTVSTLWVWQDGTVPVDAIDDARARMVDPLATYVQTTGPLEGPKPRNWSTAELDDAL